MQLYCSGNCGILQNNIICADNDKTKFGYEDYETLYSNFSFQTDIKKTYWLETYGLEELHIFVYSYKNQMIRDQTWQKKYFPYSKIVSRKTLYIL